MKKSMIAALIAASVSGYVNAGPVAEHLVRVEAASVVEAKNAEAKAQEARLNDFADKIAELQAKQGELIKESQRYHQASKSAYDAARNTDKTPCGAATDTSDKTPAGHLKGCTGEWKSGVSMTTYGK